VYTAPFTKTRSTEPFPLTTPSSRVVAEA